MAGHKLAAGEIYCPEHKALFESRDDGKCPWCGEPYEVSR